MKGNIFFIERKGERERERGGERWWEREIERGGERGWKRETERDKNRERGNIERESSIIIL